jgi:hypothetical protein
MLAPFYPGIMAESEAGGSAVLWTLGDAGRMKEMRREMCGKPADPTPLGALICPECRPRYREFRCGGCGEQVARLGDPTADWPEFDAGICLLCRIAERVAALTEADREAIRAAVSRGTVSAVIEVRKRPGWSIGDAAYAVELLRDYASSEPPASNPATDSF